MVDGQSGATWTEFRGGWSGVTVARSALGQQEGEKRLRL